MPAPVKTQKHLYRLRRSKNKAKVPSTNLERMAARGIYVPGDGDISISDAIHEHE